MFNTDSDLIEEYNKLLKKYNHLEKRLSSIIKMSDRTLLYNKKELTEKEHRMNKIIQQSDREGKKVLDLQFALEDKLKEEKLTKEEIQKLLIQQSKMAAIGEMLENITHQMKQPLSTISIIASELQLKIDFDEKIDNKTLSNKIEYILDSVNYITNTINDFKNFFNNDKIKTDFQITHTIEKTKQLVYNQCKKHNITILEDVEDISIYGVENELIQVLMNLFSNSLDVLKDIKNKESNKYIFINVYQKNNQIIIEVKDTGGGITLKENIEKVFESHFTTKDENGTGIGLYMCKNIIEQSFKGTITVENIAFSYQDKEYSGAKFTITI